MDMVVHEHIGKDAAGCAVLVNCEKLQVFLKVGGILENALLLIATSDYVVKGAGVFDARFSRHGERVPEMGECVNISIIKSDPIWSIRSGNVWMHGKGGGLQRWSLPSIDT